MPSSNPDCDEDLEAVFYTGGNEGYFSCQFSSNSPAVFTEPSAAITA
jgi:hypothetical protein